MVETGTDWKLLERRPVETGRARVVTFANQKGGVAKTTSSVTLGATLALRGHRVLLVDIDPQSNATTGLGLDPRSERASSYDVIVEQGPLADAIQPTRIRNLSCVASSLDLAGAEVELAGAPGREHRLAEALGAVRGDFDLVFIDCPPSLGLLTVNALCAAEDLIVPVQCEYYALEGLGQLVGTAERVRRSLNPGLRIAGFLLTMYDARTKLSAQVADEVRNHFGEMVFETVIPRSVRLSEAPSFGEPVVTLDPSSRGAIAYRLLAAELETVYGLQVHVPPPPPKGKEQHVIDLDQAARPGPHGRGYGHTTARPHGIEETFPPRPAWEVRA